MLFICPHCGARPFTNNEFDAHLRQWHNTHDYGWDVGNLHVIDYHLWLADLPIRRPGFGSPTSLRFTDNWTRP